MSTTTVHHGLRRRTLAWLAIAVLLAVSIVTATITAAHADDHWDFERADVYAAYDETDGWNAELPEFVYEFDIDGEECELDVVVYPYPVDELDDPQPIDTTIEVIEVDDGLGLLAFPDLDAGWYDIQVATCVPLNGAEGSETALFAVDGFGFAILEVDKVVEGDAPVDATFVVEAECEYESFDGEYLEEYAYGVEFGAEGGFVEIVLYPLFDDLDIDCTVSEIDDGGAESSTIDDGEYVILGDELYDAEADEFDTDLFWHTTTVTNTFLEAETDDEEDDEDEDEDEDEPEAEPAEAVVAEPDFTG